VAAIENSLEGKREESAKLDAIEAGLLGDLHRPRPLLAGGRRVLHHLTSEPLMDRGIDLAVVDRLLRLADRRAELSGYDAPRRREVPVVTTEMVVELINRINEDEAAKAVVQQEARDRSWGDPELPGPAAEGD
jgi:hypothetical protein